MSSKDPLKFNYACDEIKKLLVKVYQEYRNYDKTKLGKPKDYGKNLEIKMFKTFTGPKNLMD